MTPKYRAALFDLDDTLFDHQARRREALAAVGNHVAPLAGISVRDLEAAHDAQLQRTYDAYLKGALSLAQARTERMRELLGHFGVSCDDTLTSACEAVYRATYDRDWRPVPGALELLASLRDLGVWIGVITNGMQAEQEHKLRIVGLENAVDAMFVSETVGAQKPARAFFEHVLARAGFDAAECIVIGDLLETDIQGALNTGIDAIW